MCEPTNLTSKVDHSQVYLVWSPSPTPLPAHAVFIPGLPQMSPLPVPHFPDKDSFFHPPEPCLSPAVQFCCSDCPRTTARKRELRHHILRCHFPQQTEQECALCPGSFNSFSVLRLHYERAHPASPPPPGVLFLCDLCSAAYTCEAGLRYHVARTHPAHMSCILCVARGGAGQVYTYMTDLKTHYDTHRFNAEGPKAYRLLVCRLATDKVRKVTRVDGRYTCDTCQKVAFRTKYELRDHILASHYYLCRFFCRYCSYFAGSKKEILTHRNSEHPKNFVKFLGEVSDITECLDLFETENWEHKRFESFVEFLFSYHKNALHGVKGSYKNIVRKEACKRRFSSNTDLLQHFSEHHLSDMICEICHGEIFEGLLDSAGVQAIKESHEQIETTEIKSPESTKSLERLENDKQKQCVPMEVGDETRFLRRKMIMHRYLPHWQYSEYFVMLCKVKGQIREAVCFHCFKVFPDAARLVRHILSLHLGLSRPRCAKCGQKFHFHVDLEQHWNRAHGSALTYSDEEKPGGNVFGSKTYKIILKRERALKLNKAKRTERFKCVLCSVNFNSSNGLKEHFLHRHDHGLKQVQESKLVLNVSRSKTNSQNRNLPDSRDIRERNSRSTTLRKQSEFVECAERLNQEKAELEQVELFKLDHLISTERANNPDYSREKNSNAITALADHTYAISHVTVPLSNDALGFAEKNMPISSSSDISKILDSEDQISNDFVTSFPSPVPQMAVSNVSDVKKPPSIDSKGDSEKQVNAPLQNFEARTPYERDCLKVDTYRYKEAVQLIQETKRNQDRNYTCYICLRKFYDFLEIKYHILKTHLDLGRFSCAYCVFRDYSAVEVARHTIQSHPGFQLVCLTRIDTTKQPSQIDVEGPYMNQTCKFCRMRFNTEFSLKSHVEKEHLYVESQPVPCTMHEYIMNTLQNHYEVQHPLQIMEILETPRCNAEFCSIYDLGMHIDAKHKSKCEYCEFDALLQKDKNTLDICLSMWELENVVEALTPVKKEKDLYICPSCHSGLDNYMKFRNHVLSVHFGLKNYKCSSCFYEGYDPPVVMSHIGRAHRLERKKVSVLRVLGKAPYLSQHENFKSYTCSSCQSKFHTIGELRGHMASHSAEDCEPGDCDVLGKFSLQPFEPVFLSSCVEGVAGFEDSVGRSDPLKIEDSEVQDFVVCKYEMDMDQIKVEDVPLSEETIAEVTTFCDNPATPFEVRTTLPMARTTSSEASSSLVSGHSKMGTSVKKRLERRVTSRPYPDSLPPVPGGCLPCSVQL